MRIRSIKPEFYRSDDINRLPREVRLLFIGLWSYVDDNGVGVDDHRQIAADLFPLDDDPTEVRNYVRDGLATLSRGFLITRYQVSGKRYLFVTTWDKHQRIDKPAKPRFPRPDAAPTSGNGAPVVGHPDDSRDPRESVAPGTGEQGNRGTGEQILSSPKNVSTTGRSRDFAAALSAKGHTQAAHQLIDTFAETCRKRPPAAVRNELAVQVDALLAESWTTDEIHSALSAWSAKGLDARKLPSVANEIANRAPDRGQSQFAPKPSTTDQRVAAVQALKARLATNGANVLQLPSGEPR
jgi:hypothetical protein